VADSLMWAAASGERPRPAHVLTRNVSEEAGACESKLPHEEMEGRRGGSSEHMCPIHLADNPCLKVLLTDLLWEKNNVR